MAAILFAFAIGLPGEGVAQSPSGNVVISTNTTWAEGTYQISSLTVNSGATLTVGGGSAITVSGAVVVTANSNIVLQAINNTALVNGTWQGAGVTINAASVEVDAGSSINADGQGYLANAGPGGSPAGSYDGGSYGGLGAVQQYPTALQLPVYGNATAPTDLGSGGDLESGSTGAAGGGAIHLIVLGTLTVGGSISANGVPPSTTGGAGAGGSVYIQTGTLAGAGSILANGGSGQQNGAYGGGGGRLAVYYKASSSSFTGFAASTASGGNGSYSPGATGTAGFFDTSTPDAGLSVYQNFVVPSGTTVSYNSVTVQSGAVLKVGGGSVVNVDSAVKVTGALIALATNNTAQVSGKWQGAGVTINAASVEVDAGASMNADGQGYASSAGPGAGMSGANGGGGSYGGEGAVPTGGTPPLTYGSPYAPSDLGSGGGSDQLGDLGGAGGGAISLTVTGTLTNNGVISANGANNNGTGGYVGSGSGGSVYLTTGTLSGSGSIAANGGTGQQNGTYGGGGGRIALYYNTNNGFNLAQVDANGGGGSASGSPGTVYTLGANTNLIVSEDVVLPANQTLNYSTITVNNTGSLTLGSGTTLTATSISVSNGSTFNVGGGSNVTVSGALVVTGNSNVVLQGTNNTAQINGTWQGAGVTLNASSVEVDAGSSINGDGQGYVPAAGPGGAPFGLNPGGSYGGLGGVGDGSNPGIPFPIYGSAAAPIDLGSGGSSTNGTVNGSYGGSGGGAVRLIVTGTLTNNGIISANGQTQNGENTNASGGSGGSVFIQTATLAGTGSILANGGGAFYAGAGGGGRVAVYFTTNSGFEATQVTATGGSGGANGANGSVVFTSTPSFALFAPAGSVLHGTKTLQWFAGAVDLVHTTVKLVASGPDVQTLGSGLGANSSLSLDTTTLANGKYEFRLTFYDANGNDIQEVPRTFVINNSLAWHTGILTSNQEWTASQVQGIDGTVIIPSGVTVTIDPGTIVKATPGAQIIVQSGGILNALGTASNPIIFTTFDDSSVGGDSDFSGGETVPSSGEWNGISVDTGGQFNSNSYTELLYLESSLSGTLGTNQTLQTTEVYQISGMLVVPSGVTLTIQPGTVVKFAANAGIDVQPGGQLVAMASIAQPIYFTSINDSSVGGNTSGNAQPPAPGDWGTILIDGASATFNYVHFLYGGGPPTSSNLLGMLQTSDNATVTISNSVLSNSFYVGLLTGYPNAGGTIALTNSVVSGVEDRGIDAFAGSTVNVTNDTFDANGSGMEAHGGTINVANTIVSNSTSTQYGGIAFYQGALNVSYTDVWTSATGVANYVGITDPTGSNGNISSSPVYVNAPLGDYRLNFGSPAIDAADGPLAPLTDSMGNPRYNDPRVSSRTGVPNANGNYPDMGAFEYVESAPSDIDLTVPSVTGPASAIVGTQVQLTWTDENTGSGTAQGAWHDAIYLVQNPDTNPVALLAGEVLVASGVTLGPGASVVSTGTITVPGVAVGNYRWEVKANDRGEVFTGKNSVNAVGLSLDPVAIDLPGLVVDAAPTAGSFAATGRSAWYKLIPGAGKTIVVNLGLAGGATTGAVQLFIGQGYVPTPQRYDYQQSQFDSTSVSVVIPNTSSETYYVTAYAQQLTSSPAPFNLSASTVKFSLTSVQPNSVPNVGSATLTFVGGGFTSAGSYQIVDSSGMVYNSSSVFITDSAHAAVTFAMSGLPTGTYSAQVIQSGSTVSLSNALSVTLPGSTGSGGSSTSPGGQIQVDVVAPTAFRSGFPAEVTLNYQNVSGSDLPAPMIYLSVTGASFSELPPQCAGCNVNFPAMYQVVSNSGLVLGISNQGPAGILPAGASGSITFLATSLGGNVTFTTQVVSTAVSDPIVGSVPAQECTTLPSGCPVAGIVKHVTVHTSSVGGANPEDTTTASIGIFSDAAGFCNAILPPFTNAAGFSRTCMQLLVSSHYDANPTTLNSDLEYLNLDGRNVDSLLAADATALSSQGVYEFDADRLLGFELENDGYYVFNQRYHQGAFGFGTSHPYDITAEISGGVNVIHYPDGHSRTFPTQNLSQMNQYLGAPGDYGVLTVGTDGTWTITESDGVVYHFVLDTQSNSTTRQLLNYIQDLNGNRITMTYTNDLVTSATDNFGNTYTYVYDSLGHITQATDEVGRVTSYTYDIKSDSLNSTFLTSVTDSSGTTNIAWNEGGPSGIGYFGDVCVSTYCEPAIGVNTITYPDGSHKYFTYDALGRVASAYRDGNAEKIEYSYGAAGSVTSTDANGNVSLSNPNENGDVAQYTDPLGSVLQATYDPEDKLIGLRGPLGTSTSLSYDSQGNVASLLDPLGNQQSSVFTSYNNLQSSATPAGDPLLFTYDSHYNPTVATYPDGTAVNAIYDAAGNMTSWANRRGHTISYTYDSVNLLTSKTYANGSSINYTYDGHRNLASVTAANGTTSFTYDSADRLTGITYPSGQSITYTYNSGGQRTGMSDSTGFAVHYAYDASGRLSQLTSSSGATIVSYTYDAAGQLAAKKLGNGTSTTYTYDADGNPLQLTNSSSSGSAFSQFAYTYDALDRQTTMNAPSGAWAYGYDGDSQVNSVTLPGSSIQYTYDADGNRTTGAGLTYNANNLDQYTAAGTAGYSYDADGNLISGAGWTYTYDDDNELIGMVSATDTWAYQYDGLGNRVSATHNGTVTQYLNDLSGNGNVEAELTGSGQLTSHYTYGLDLTSAVPASGSAAYYYFDASGNTAQMTNSSGSVVNSYTYLPFGEKLASTVGVANPFTYVGEFGVMDEGSGLYFMRNRWYSPALGRFVQQDPIGLAGGSNLYRYARNQPTGSVDPDGTEPAAVEVNRNNREELNKAMGLDPSGKEDYSGTATPAAFQEKIEKGRELIVEVTGSAVAATIPEVEVGGVVADHLAHQFVIHPLGEAAFKAAAGPGGEEHEHEPETEHEPKPKSPVEPNPGPKLVNPNEPKDTTTKESKKPLDPNGKLTSGFGDQGFVPPNTPIVYTIYFENQSTATAPAEQVVVTDPLAANLDWSTVELSQIQFNNVTINVPAGQQSYIGQVNVSTDPNPVSVNAALNPSTGVLSWTMQSINPATGGLPADPLAGFLPPNNASNQGTGYLIFSVKPKSSLSNATVISNQASIVFDVNASISTNTVTNTLDSVLPTSSVGALPATTTTLTIPVTWSGSDSGGAGIASYTIYVSTNSGPYTIWQPTSAATSATYNGTAGTTYSFYSIATDNAGNIQQTPGPAQTTTVSAVATSAASIAAVSGSGQTAAYGSSFASPLIVIVKDASGNALSGVSVSFAGTGLSFSSSTATTGSNGQASVMVSAAAAGSLTATASTSGVTGTATFSLTATQVPLTVTATNASVAYGQPIPALTYSITGFVNGDTSSAVTGAPSETTTATKGSSVGTYPITIAKGTLASTNYSFPTFTNGTLTITSLGTVATPAFSSAAGTYTSIQTVTITDATAGATIYYTTNGSTPTTSSTKYTGSITVGSSETLQAIAIASGYANSAVASAAYVINLPAAATPAFSPAAGTYNASQTVTITDATSGASIYYTTNGTAPTTSSTLYAGAITVSSSETIEAIAVATGYTQSAVASAAYTITPPAATPVLSLPGGTYTSAQTVTITDTTAGSTIYYTTNGTTPTTTSTVYSGALTVNASETVEAIATASSYSTSAVATAAYIINLPATATPTFSPAAGTYTSAQSVTISDSTSSATIYYTTDGTTPTTTSTKYTGPINVASSETIKAIATASGDTQSAVATALYTISIPPPTAATPAFSPAAGTYTSVQAVTITDTTTGAAIYYTLDGSTPTASSSMYSSPISVGSSETIQAIAVANGYANSTVAMAAYIINLPPASFTLTATPASVSVTDGQSGIVTLNVTPENGFTSPIAFTCSGLPAGAACSFSPGTVTPAGAPVVTKLTITTAANAEIHPLVLWTKAAGAICIALILWPFRRRSRLVAIVSAMILLISGGALVGCGGAPSSNSKTYTVTITATGGGVSQTVPVSLTVDN